MRGRVGLRVATRCSVAVTVRAFLALPVAGAAAEDLATLRSRLADDVAGVRWAPAGTPHVTVHFFGNVDPASAARAVAALQPVCLATGPMTLRLEGLGVFPSRGAPRVLWCGVEDTDGALTGFVRACRDAIERDGFPVERRPYHPHCTLGRPRAGWSAGPASAWDAAVARGFGSRPFVTDRLVLYESIARPAGPEHAARATVVLAGAAAQASGSS